MGNISLPMTIPFPPIYFKYQGIFNLEEFFKVGYNWFLSEGYQVSETKYKHKIPNAKGSEAEVKWAATRKMQHFLQYNIKLGFKIYEIKDVDIQGKKATHGRIKMVIDGNLVLDPAKNWNIKNVFMQQIANFFFKVIFLPQDVDVLYGDPIYYKLWELQTAFKEYLDMEAKTNAFHGWA